MESRVKFLGHSVHPILIVFPLGLLSTATIFDVIHAFNDNENAAIVAYWMMVSGVLGGVLAASSGWLDWFAIPSDTRAKRIGLMHGSANAVVLLLFAVNIYLRNDEPASPSMFGAVLSVLAFLLALFGGWLGGELVERLGVAVHEGANLNAPNSLFEDSAKSTKGPVKEV